MSLSVIASVYELTSRGKGFDPNHLGRKVFEDKVYHLSHVEDNNRNYNDRGKLIVPDWEESQRILAPKRMFDKQAVIERISQDLRKAKRGLGISTKDSYAEYCEDEGLHIQHIDHNIMQMEEDLEFLLNMSDYIEAKPEVKEKISLKAGKEYIDMGWSLDKIVETFDMREDYLEKLIDYSEKGGTNA